MKYVLYLSEATVAFSENDLDVLVDKASLKNKKVDITGYLCFFRNRFIQYIEGDSDAINELLSTLRNDTRHEFIYELELDEIENRIFSSWSMRYITSEELSQFNLEHYVEQNLLYIKNNFSHKERCREFILEHVMKISAYQDIIKKRSIRRKLLGL